MTIQDDDVVALCAYCGESVGFRQSHVFANKTKETWHLTCHDMKTRKAYGGDNNGL